MNKRSPVNKRASARSFNKNSRTVARANIKPTPMRGGIRL